jgi:hypothetical protein
MHIGCYIAQELPDETETFLIDWKIRPKKPVLVNRTLSLTHVSVLIYIVLLRRSDDL